MKVQSTLYRLTKSGKHFISGLNPCCHPESPLDAYIQDEIESEQVIPANGGGCQCNEKCCLFPENIRTSYGGLERAQHDKMRNTPGLWSEDPKHLEGFKKKICSKCPGTHGTGMIDHVTAPRNKKSTVGAPFHALSAYHIKRHAEAIGVPCKKSKVLPATITRRLTLTSKDIPFATPPWQCGLYGATYSSESETKKCNRLTCPIRNEGGANSWLIFPQFD